jgi:hypothetical protein
MKINSFIRYLLFLQFSFPNLLLANDTSAVSRPKPLIFSFNAEPYFLYDLYRHENGNRPDFFNNFDRHGELLVNLAAAKASYAKGAVRANLALATGTYMESNYAIEPGILGHLLEANLGIRLDKNGQWWLDAGVMPAHIAFESNLWKDNWALTHSIVTDNSPLYQTGVKLGYSTEKGDWLFVILGLNGWQRIHVPAGYSVAHLGTQITYKPNDRLTLNHSAFFGSETPDTARLFRQYHNLYGIFQLDPKLGLTVGFDIGWQEKSPHANGSNTWFSPVAIMRYQPTDPWAMALRAEYYGDPAGVVVATGTPNGFRTRGMSLNVDYAPSAIVLLRLEGRLLKSRDPIFPHEGILKDSNASATITASISL